MLGEHGADDYLAKPFAFEELLARVRALLRRRGEQRAAILTEADLTLDPQRREAMGVPLTTGLMTERWRGFVLIGCVAVALGACATFDPLEDTRIESEVKARLVGEKEANLTRVGVVSRKGTVYLSGTVGTPEQRAQAAMLANGVNGVGRVVNTLEVRPAPR